ncbi:MAG: hypothetical protein E7299_09125 [Lachnospiraceae bacterium]|nr:hypothetical protein [Lachnospiraceae bacterium]
MSLLSVQQKLELEQQLKLQQQENRMQMKRRENLVYGLKATDYSMDSERDDVTSQPTEVSKKGLVMRCILAIVLFGLVCMMKYQNLSVARIDYQTLLNSLANTDFINGIDFTEYITYTDI